jgi:hypothetical protein
MGSVAGLASASAMLAVAGLVSWMLYRAGIRRGQSAKKT